MRTKICFFFFFFFFFFYFFLLKSLHSGSISYYIHLFIESKNDRLNFPRKKLFSKTILYMTTLNTYTVNHIDREVFRWIYNTQHTNEKEKSSSLFFVRFFRCCVGIFDGFYVGIYIYRNDEGWFWYEFFFFHFSVHEFFV